jgi:hypothetical protein
MADNQESGAQILRGILKSVGLETLADDVIGKWKRTEIPSNIGKDELGFMLRETDAYKKRFPGNEALRKANKPEYTISEYLQLEKDYRNAIQGKGIPSGFYDSTDYIGKFIANDVAVAEVSRRVDQGFRAVSEGDPEILRQLKEFYPEVNEGELAAFFLSPDEARPIIVNRAKAAQIAAQGTKQAGMQITKSEAESLIQQGVDESVARQAFSNIAANEGLFQPGMAGEEAVSREEQLQFGIGNAQAQQRIATRRRRRQAEFEAGGAFTAGATGVSGLGTAQR